jgi:hypothetical protein
LFPPLPESAEERFGAIEGLLVLQMCDCKALHATATKYVTIWRINHFAEWRICVQIGAGTFQRL